MPKLKTHSGAKKRFRLTKSGHVKRAHAFTGHDIKGCKSGKQKRALRKNVLADSTNVAEIKRMIPYK